MLNTHKHFCNAFPYYVCAMRRVTVWGFTLQACFLAHVSRLAIQGWFEVTATLTRCSQSCTLSAFVFHSYSCLTDASSPCNAWQGARMFGGLKVSCFVSTCKSYVMHASAPEGRCVFAHACCFWAVQLNNSEHQANAHPSGHLSSKLQATNAKQQKKQGNCRMCILFMYGMWRG